MPSTESSPTEKPSNQKPPIELTCWGHAGLRLERDGTRLAVDPGAFTDPAVLDGAAAVLVTHGHPDHVSPEALAAVVAADGGPQVWAPAPVVEALVAAGAPAERVHTVAAGDELDVAGFAVRAVGGTHAVIHPDIPLLANVGYLVEGAVLHPGDAFPDLPDGADVRVLALPVAAPWLRLADAVDYARRMTPGVVVPIHDVLLSDIGKAAFDRITTGLLGEIVYRRLAPGEPLTVQPR